MSHLKQVAMCPLETSLVASDEGGDSKSFSMVCPKLEVRNLLLELEARCMPKRVGFTAAEKLALVNKMTCQMHTLSLEAHQVPDHWPRDFKGRISVRQDSVET